MKKILKINDVIHFTCHIILIVFKTYQEPPCGVKSMFPY